MSGILVIRIQGLGDIIHLIPSLKMLREKFPERKIALLCKKGFGQIVPAEYKIKIIELPAHASFFEMIKLIKIIRREKFDELYDLFANPRTALISLFSGIKKRFGFNYRIRKHAYNGIYTPPNPNKHLMQLFANFFENFGIKGTVYPPSLTFSSSILNHALRAISDVTVKSPLLGINPNSACQSRSWPAEHIINFINLWYDKTHSPVLLTWGPGELQKVEQILSKVDSQKAFTHKALKTNEFLALISKLDLFLTPDTGPMNFAWAVGTPTVALYGATTPEPTAPRGKNHLVLFKKDIPCLRCHKDFCSHKKCMHELTPNYVLNCILEKYNLSNTRAEK